MTKRRDNYCGEKLEKYLKRSKQKCVKERKGDANILGAENALKSFIIGETQPQQVQPLFCVISIMWNEDTFGRQRLTFLATNDHRWLVEEESQYPKETDIEKQEPEQSD